MDSVVDLRQRTEVEIFDWDQTFGKMFSKMLSLVYLLLLFVLSKTFAVEDTSSNNDANILQIFVKNLSSEDDPSLKNNCNIYNKEYRRLCLAIFKNSTHPNVATNSPSVENCKAFSGSQFKSCLQVFMLESEGILRTKPSSWASCTQFSGEKARFCSEMPANYFNNEDCVDCAVDKVRFCLDIYKSNSSTPTTAAATTTTPSQPESTSKPLTTRKRRKFHGRTRKPSSVNDKHVHSPSTLSYNPFALVDSSSTNAPVTPKKVKFLHRRHVGTTPPCRNKNNRPVSPQ